VLGHVQKLLAAPELVARIWSAAKREGEDQLTEREVTVLLADFATVWSKLFPAEEARGCLMQPLLDQAEGIAALDHAGAVAVAVAPAWSPNAIRAVRRPVPAGNPLTRACMPERTRRLRRGSTSRSRQPRLSCRGSAVERRSGRDNPCVHH
jgi:hypothetical protein